MLKMRCLILFLILPTVAMPAGRITLEIGAASGANWQAKDIVLEAGTDGALHASAESLRFAPIKSPASFRLDCPAVARQVTGIRCEQGQIDATIVGLGKIIAGVEFVYGSAEQWRFMLTDLRGDAIKAPLLQVEQTPKDLSAQLTVNELALDAMRPFQEMLRPMPGIAYAGRAAGSIHATRHSDARWAADYDLRLADLKFNEPGGHYATEGLNAHIQGSAQSRTGNIDVQVKVESASGQLYLEPIFNDFGTHPLEAETRLRWDASRQELAITDTLIEQKEVMRARLAATMKAGAKGLPDQLQLDLLDGSLPGVFAIYAQPFLTGGRLDPLRTGGHVAGTLRINGNRVISADLTLKNATVEASKIDAGLSGINGELFWRADTTPPASHLHWTGGHFAKLALGEVSTDFLAQGKAFRLIKSLRQAVLDGAFNISRLALRGLGQSDMTAEFEADVEPIDLREFSRALGWPELSGQLSGNLPGLTLKDGEIKLDGALVARAFDGDITLSELRVIDAFGVVPRIAANLRLRDLDLLAVTSAFSFGSMEGRIDGDVTGLRVLGGRPVAFDARLQTPPNDRSRHRISQRAIENISSIGGGPTGVLSNGVLRVFESFPYDRIGWSCRLANEVCLMDGIGPAPQNGYVLVKGKWLPRIDVIGYAREVNWPTFMEQLRSVRLDQAQVR